MEDNMRSFKRPYEYDPVFQNSGNKRGKFGDQISETSHSSDTLYRILCPSRKIGGVIGKGGVIIRALREETQARITVDDSVPGSEERVVLIYSPSMKKPVKQNDMNLQCAAQDALLKVHDKILEEDNNEKSVSVRLLVPHNMVGCVLGKKGDVIQRLRKETGASIRVLPADQLPVCALSTDELLQISAKPAIAKRALYEVSTLLHHHPRKDNPIPFGHQGFRPPGPQMTNLPPPANPYARWRGGYDSDHSRIRSLEFDDDRFAPHGGDTPAEFSMKILCPAAKIGGVIGKGGSNVRQIQQETGTSIRVDDVAADSEERVICVSSFEGLWNPRSRTIDAVLALQDKTIEHNEKGIVTSRLLMASSKVGCILGQGGQVINEMRRRTKADIRVYSKEEKPKSAGIDEELVQVSGLYDCVKDALAEIASRYRARCLRDAKPEPKPSPRGGHISGYEPFKGGGRDYEPLSYRAPTRDHEPYSHLVPSRDYEPYSLQAPLRDHEPYSHRAPPRDHEPYSHQAPPRDHEPYSHRAPTRDYEPRGYLAPLRDYESNIYADPHMGYSSPPSASRFLGGVDLKMSSNSRGSAIGNATEISGTRPYGAASESSIADIRDPSHFLSSTDDTYQIHNGPKRPSPNYQNYPRQQHYSLNSYQY